MIKMNFEKIAMLLLITNLGAIFRFVVFSNFNKIQVIVSLVFINIVVISGLVVYSTGNYSLYQTDIIIGMIIGVGILFAVFYAIEKRK